MPARVSYETAVTKVWNTYQTAVQAASKVAKRTNPSDDVFLRNRFGNGCTVVAVVIGLLRTSWLFFGTIGLTTVLPGLFYASNINSTPFTDVFGRKHNYILEGLPFVAIAALCYTADRLIVSLLRGRRFAKGLLKPVHRSIEDVVRKAKFELIIIENLRAIDSETRRIASERLAHELAVSSSRADALGGYANLLSLSITGLVGILLGKDVNFFWKGLLALSGVIAAINALRVRSAFREVQNLLFFLKYITDHYSADSRQRGSSELKS
jgi:hypothetical protein